MMGEVLGRANILGDLRAEADRRMLDLAFYDTLDFRTLVESGDRVLVVGRRGAGKSALLYRLQRHWADVPRSHLVSIAPEEDQVIAWRPTMSVFGDTFRGIRAASKILWKYAVVMEVASHLQNHYKFKDASCAKAFRPKIQQWLGSGGEVSSRLRATIRGFRRQGSAEEAIGDLATELDLEQVQQSLHEVLSTTSVTCVVLIDRLDEGYEPDITGVAMAAGIIHAVNDIKLRFPMIRPTVFLRDNIYRAVAGADPDFSRDIEGQVLRLHWDEPQLFYLVCIRLRVAFDLSIEQNRKIWDSCTASTLHGMEGFRACLRLTLYRPRDLLALLNEAFYVAAREGRRQITLTDIEATARDISINRYGDLVKEYSAIIPSIALFTRAFVNGSPEIPLSEARRRLEGVVSEDTASPQVQQDLFIHEDSEAAIRSLYSVGFFGLRDPLTGTFVFCHDGKSADRNLAESASVLVHPCYWMALNLTRSALAAEEAEEINDEYEIEVSPGVPSVRREKIRVLRTELSKIPLGNAGSGAFEEWCLKAIRVGLGGHLRNIQLKPNVAAVQRRDIVGTNLSESPLWKRIRETYDTRQVIFEAKNYQGLGPNEFRQTLSYLTGDYGRLAFIVTRDESVDLQKGSELEWVRELYDKHQRLVVKLTAGWLARLLGKTEDPAKHDVVDVQLNSLLDDYVRLYLSGQVKARRRKRA